MTPMLSPMVLLYLRVGLNPYVNPKWASQELEGFLKNMSSLNTLNETNVDKCGQVGLHLYLSLPRQAPKFPHGWLKIFNSLGYIPHYDLVDHRW